MITTATNWTMSNKHRQLSVKAVVRTQIDPTGRVTINKGTWMSGAASRGMLLYAMTPSVRIIATRINTDAGLRMAIWLGLIALCYPTRNFV